MEAKRDLSFMTTMDLVVMQHELKKYPEDKEMLTEVLRELKKRM